MRKLLLTVLVIASFFLTAFTIETATQSSAPSVSILGPSQIQLPPKGGLIVEAVWRATNYDSNFLYEWFYNGTKVGEGQYYYRDYGFMGYTVNQYDIVEVKVSCPCCPCCGSTSATKSVHVIDDQVLIDP